MIGHNRIGSRGLKGPTSSVPLGIPLLDYINAGYARSGTALYHTSATTVTTATANVKRFDSRSNGAMLLCEPQRTNLIIQANVQNNAAWVKANCTTTANSATLAPDGTGSADVLVVSAGGTPATSTQTVTVSSGNHTFSLWVRSNTTTQGCYISINDGVSTVVTSFTPTTTWQRVKVTMNATAVVAVCQIGLHTSGGNGTASDDLLVWGAQLEAVSYMTSNIITVAASVTIGADICTYTTGNYPATLGTQRWAFNWRPVTASNEIALSQSLMSFGSNADELLMSNAEVITVVVGTTTVVTATAITYSADQNIYIYLNPAAGQITIVGATTGNGTSTGTAWTWPTTGTLRIGGRQSGSNVSVARYGQPFTW